MLALTVDRDAVRAVIFKNGIPTAWHRTPIGLDSGQVTARHIEETFQSLENAGSRRAKVVSDLPLLSTLMRQINFPKIDRRNLPRVMAALLLESLPFEADEVDLAWRLRRSGRDYEAFACGSPRTAIERRFGELASGGVRPRALYARAAALASVAAVSDGIIVWIGNAGAEAVLLESGLPRIAHEIRRPVDGSGTRAFGEALVKAVETVAAYRQSMSVAETPADALPVILTGPMAGDPALGAALNIALKGEFRALPGSPGWPAEFPLDEYAVNVGLARTDAGASRGHSSSAARLSPAINLLPARHMPRPLPVMPVAAFALIAAAGAGAFVASISLTETESARDRLVAVAARQAASARDFKLRQGQATFSDRKASETAAEAAALESQLLGIAASIDQLEARYQLLTAGPLPAGARLATFSTVEDGFSVTGYSTSFEDALMIGEGLRSSGLFGSVRVVRADQQSVAGAKPGLLQVAPAAVNFRIIASSIDGASTASPGSPGPEGQPAQ